MRRTCAALVMLLAAAALSQPPAYADDGPTTSTDQLGPDDVVRDVAAPTFGKLGGLHRDGDRIVATVTVGGAARAYQDDLDDGEGWVPVPGQDQPGVPPFAGIEAAAGGVTVVRRDTPSGFTHTISNGAGSWTLARGIGATLSSDGAYVVVGRSGDFDGAVYATDSGTPVMDLPGDVEDGVVDSGRLWTIDQDGTIERRDLDARGALPEHVATVPRCGRAYEPLQVRGRWAVVQCGFVSRSTSATWVVDLTGALSTSAIVESHSPTPARLTAGALAFGFDAIDITETASQGPPRHVMTAYPSMAADDSGSGFAYRDPTGEIHLLDPLLQPSSDDDVTPPTAEMIPVPAVIKAGGALTVSWSSNDAAGSEGPGSGVYRYDVNESVQSRAPSSYTTSLRAGETSFTRTLLNQEQRCFRVRAVDRKENVGAWSAPSCTLVDATGPFAFRAPYPIALQPHGSDGLVDVGYHFDVWPDPGGSTIDHYETRYAQSSQGSTVLGAWVAPRSADVRSRSVTIAAGRRICFQGRAVDRVGNDGDWTRSSCTVAPYDDSLLTLHGPSPTYRSSSAYGGKARTLGGSSSLSVASGSSANCVTVRARGGSSSAPGRLLVLVAGHDRGTITSRAGGWRNLSPGSRVCGRGTVTLRHDAGTAPVTVDWIGLVRSGDRGYES